MLSPAATRGWYLQDVGAEHSMPAPTPPTWLPWKPACFPQKTSLLHSPPPRRWGLTHIHPRKGHRLGDGDRPRRRDREHWACSARWGGRIRGSEEAKSHGHSPTARARAQGGTCSSDLSRMGHGESPCSEIWAPALPQGESTQLSSS